MNYNSNLPGVSANGYFVPNSPIGSNPLPTSTSNGFSAPLLKNSSLLPGTNYNGYFAPNYPLNSKPLPGTFNNGYFTPKI